MKKLRKGNSKTGRVYTKALKLKQAVPAGVGPHLFYFECAPSNANWVVIPDCYVNRDHPYKGLTVEMRPKDDHFISDDFYLAAEIPRGTYLEVYNYKK